MNNYIMEMAYRYLKGQHNLLHQPSSVPDIMPFMFWVSIGSVILSKFSLTHGITEYRSILGTGRSRPWLA